MLETNHVVGCTDELLARGGTKMSRKNKLCSRWAYLVSIPILFFAAAGRNWAKWIISEISDFRSTVLAAQSVVWCKYKSHPPPLLSQPEAEFIPCSSSSFFPFPGGSTHHLPPPFSSGWVQKDYVIDGKKHKKCTQIVATAKTHRFYWVGSSIFFE